MKPQTYWRWSFLVKALLLTFIFPVLASLPFALLFYKNHDIANFVIAIGFYILIVPSLLTTIIATIFALAMRLYRKRTSTFIVSSIGIYASVIYGIFIFGKSYSQTNRDLIFIIICFALYGAIFAFLLSKLLPTNITTTNNISEKISRPWRLLFIFSFFEPQIISLLLFFRMGGGSRDIFIYIMAKYYIVGAIPSVLTALAAIMMNWRKNMVGVVLCTIAGAISAYLFGGIGLTFYGLPFMTGSPLFIVFGTFATFILALIFLPTAEKHMSENTIQTKKEIIMTNKRYKKFQNPTYWRTFFNLLFKAPIVLTIITSVIFSTSILNSLIPPLIPIAFFVTYTLFFLIIGVIALAIEPRQDIKGLFIMTLCPFIGIIALDIIINLKLSKYGIMSAAYHAFMVFIFSLIFLPSGSDIEDNHER
jgi:membrane protein